MEFECIESVPDTTDQWVMNDNCHLNIRLLKIHFFAPDVMDYNDNLLIYMHMVIYYSM